MKRKFQEYFPLSDVDLLNLREGALFVFDTSSLLSLYLLKKETTDSYLNLLNQLKEKNWIRIPNHVYEEFLSSRFNKISELINPYSKIISDLIKTRSNIINSFDNIWKEYKKHPYIDIENNWLLKKLIN